MKESLNSLLPNSENPIDLAIAKYWCEQDHLFFTRYFFKPREGFKFRVNWHHVWIADTVDRVIRGELKNVVINVPPGSSKTELVSINLIARGLALNPKARFLHISYSDDLARLNSETAKAIVESDEYQALWPLPVAKNANSKKRWHVIHEGQKAGGVYAVSLGGQITGFRAGRMAEGFWGAIIVDDPLKPKDAHSRTLRNAANRALLNTVKSRKANPDTPIIVIMQRLAEDDPTGFIQQGGLGDDWTFITIPALIDDAYVATMPKKYQMLAFPEAQTASQKTASQETASQKTASQKTESQETASQEIASQKTASQKTASQETASQKTASQKTASQKTASQETASQKTASQKTASQEAASQKTASQKTASQKTASQETASQKTASQKTESQKTESQKTESQETASQETASQEAKSQGADAQKADALVRAEDGRFSYWEYKEPVQTLMAMAQGTGKHQDKQKMSRYVFAGQYQQRPSPEGGDLIRGDWFGRFAAVPALYWRAAYVDTAQKTREHNDYTVFALFGKGMDGRIYLLELVRRRVDAVGLEELAQKLWAKWRQTDAVSPVPFRYFAVEDKASGTGLIQQLKRRHRIPVKALQRSRDKFSRLMDVQAQIECGNVMLPEQADWVAEFVAECEAFTADDRHLHDDQVDTLIDAVNDMLYASVSMADIL